MICPHCNNELKLAPNNAFRNVETYGTPNRVVTTCCNKIISVYRKISLHVLHIDSPDIKEDSWGNKLK